jgi:tetratricopeptide (TPR) repeat protein
MKKAMGFIQSGSFKKISTIIGIIGVIIGVILGIYQISQEISKAKETQKEIQIQLSIGDSFSERKEYSSAIKEYEKALSFDKDNIEVHRRIITASRRKFELQLTSLTKYPFGVESQEVDDTLARVYRVYTLNSSSKEDVGLLLEEALILKAAKRLRASIIVLEKAHNLFPNNPDVLSELGYLNSSKENIEAIDLIRCAIEIQPSNPRYHYYLAETAKNAALYAEAIREYNRTAMLAFNYSQLIVELPDRWFSYPDEVEESAMYNMHAFDSKELSGISCNILHKIFLDHGLNEESLLNSELDMPLDERAHVLEYCHEKGELEAQYAQGADSYVYLARTYYELGDFKKATATIQSVLEYPNTPDYFILYAMFLEEGNLEPGTLKEVYAKLGNYSYPDNLFGYYYYKSILWNHAHDYFIKNFMKGHEGNIIRHS